MGTLLKLLASIPKLADLFKWLAETWRAYEKDANVAEADQRASQKRASFNDAIRAAQQRNGVSDNPPAPRHSSGNPEPPGVSGGSPSGA